MIGHKDRPTSEYQVEASTLYLIPTPIGNLGDMTIRSIDTLRAVDLVACEDTRTTSKLFQHFGISTRRTSFHAHNEHNRTKSLVERLIAGSSIALVSDAGSPGISDPGYLLVRRAIESGIRVVPLPGPTALIPALSASGLPTDRFVFEGFLPPKKGRVKRLTELSDETRTIVLYESPHRIQKLMTQIVEIFGEDRIVVIARELTKKFEEFSRGTAKDYLVRISDMERVRGELVVLIAGKGHDASSLGEQGTDNS